MVWEEEGVPDIAGMFDPAFGAMLLVLAAWLTPAPPIPRANAEAVVRTSFRTFTSKSARWQIAALSLPTPRAIRYCSNHGRRSRRGRTARARTHHILTALAGLSIIADDSKRICWGASPAAQPALLAQADSRDHAPAPRAGAGVSGAASG